MFGIKVTYVRIIKKPFKHGQNDVFLTDFKLVL